MENEHDKSASILINEETSSVVSPDKIQQLNRTKKKKKTHKKQEKKKKEENDNKVVNKDTEEDNNKYNLVPMNSIPKLEIFHNETSEKKKLDISYEDYFFYEIVDDDSFIKFVKMTQNYISKRINDKTIKLFNSLKRQISEAISSELSNIKSHSKLINKTLDEEINKPIPKKSCLEKICSCCFKKKEKLCLNGYYNLKNKVENIDNAITNFAEDVINKYDDNYLDTICNYDQDEIETLTKNKTESFLNKKGVQELLRGEVEHYSKYFNIETIIEKQQNTLQTQQTKTLNLKQVKELNECIICMEKQRNVMFIPCYHLICCETCGLNEQMVECPECKVTIQNKTIIN